MTIDEKGNVGLYNDPNDDRYEQLADGKWYLRRNAEAIERLGVGDVTSDEKGSGARYNTGKPPMAYIPLRQQLIVWRGYKRMTRDMLGIISELIRFEQGEVPMWNVVSLLSLTDLNDATYVWDYGANKYSAFNWAKGMKWSIPLACISRHVQAILGGEELDAESGCKHWGHVVCNILMLEHYEQFYKDGDDRPPPEVFSS